MKKAFTLVEIGIVIVLLLLTSYLVIPSLLDDTKQAESISKWKYSYHNIEYVFSAVNTQIDNSTKEKFAAAKTDKERESFLLNLLSSYMRIKNPISVKEYKTYYMNSNQVKEDDIYYFDNLYLTHADNIIGLKWLGGDEKTSLTNPIAMLLFDVNGLKAPNKWGVDIFGVNIFNGRLEPFGKHLSEDILKQDCSTKGSGIYCSYYYYTYGSYIE